MDNTFPNPLLKKAKSLYGLKKYSEALQLINQALELMPMDQSKDRSKVISFRDRVIDDQNSM